MDLNKIGNWSSIIGLAITVFTFFLAANVNRKVNRILKAKNDKSFFEKRVSKTISDLTGLKELAETEQISLLYGTKQYSEINTAIDIVNSSWDALFQYENKLPRLIKIFLWKVKFKRIQYVYAFKKDKHLKFVIRFLNEFITFLEKEKENDGQ